MSLTIPTNQQIIDKFEYRWPRICIDPHIWNHPKIINLNPVNDWHEVKFEQQNFNALDHLIDQQGIYMFIVKPNDIFTNHHSYILYVGETKNLRARFQTYFSYKNTKHPSDQKKRRMVLVWENYLYFNYFLTDFTAKSDRVSAEYDLIDSIAPPMNDDFRSKVLNIYKKSLQF